MAERERSRDRPSGHQSSSSASGTGAFAQIMNLMSISKGSKGKSVTSPEPIKSTIDVPFDLDGAIRSMLEDRDSPELVEIMKGISTHLTSQGDIFMSDAKPIISQVRLSMLYNRIVILARSQSEPMQYAIIRLLSILIVHYPRNNISKYDRMALYTIVTRLPGHSTDLTLLQVQALKNLTVQGAVVDGMDGIAGWLVKALSAMTADWMAWCGKTLSNHESVTPHSDTVMTATSVLLVFLSNLIHHHAPLLLAADLNQVVLPVLDFFQTGIATCSSHSDYLPLLISESPTITQLSALGIDTHRLRFETPSPPGSSAIRNINKAVSSPANDTPKTGSAVRTASSRSSELRWTGLLAPFCALSAILFEETALSQEDFEQITVFACLCLGQDYDEVKPESSFEPVLQLFVAASGGRKKSEMILALRTILYGKARKASIRVPEAEMKVARGAVM